MVDNGSSMKRKKKCPSLTLCCFQIPHCRRSHHNQLQLAMISPRISIVVSSSPGWTLQGKLKFISVEIQSVWDCSLWDCCSFFLCLLLLCEIQFRISPFFSSPVEYIRVEMKINFFESQPSPAMHLWAFLTVKTKTHSRRINLISSYTFELGRVRQVWLGSAQGKNRREAIFLLDVF